MLFPHFPRTSLLDSAPVPLTEEALLNLVSGGSEMERGLLETLMTAPDEGSIRRNKERRRSVKERRRSHRAEKVVTEEGLKRSR